VGHRVSEAEMRCRRAILLVETNPELAQTVSSRVWPPPKGFVGPDVGHEPARMDWRPPPNGRFHVVGARTNQLPRAPRISVLREPADTVRCEPLGDAFGQGTDEKKKKKKTKKKQIRLPDAFDKIGARRLPTKPFPLPWFLVARTALALVLRRGAPEPPRPC